MLVSLALLRPGQRNTDPYYSTACVDVPSKLDWGCAVPLALRWGANSRHGHCNCQWLCHCQWQWHMDIVNAHQGYHVSKAFTRPLSKNAFASCFQEPAANSTPNPRWVLPGLPSPEELLEISQSWASPGNPRQSFLWQHCLNMYKCTPMLLRQGAEKASQPVQLGCAGNPLSLYLPCHPALAMSKTHVGQWEEWKSWRPREGTSCLSGHQFEYTRISAASWMPTVSDDNVNDVAICQRATLSVQKAEWLP